MKNSTPYIAILTVVLAFVAGNAFAGVPPPSPSPVPDAGSTSLLLGFSVMGLAAVKRFVKR